jgi:splicing factor 3A subunit 2
MSAYEQKIETPDPSYQYLLFAAEPYETIGLKIPAQDMDKREDRMFAYWDKDVQVYSLQILYK